MDTEEEDLFGPASLRRIWRTGYREGQTEDRLLLETGPGLNDADRPLLAVDVAWAMGAAAGVVAPEGVSALPPKWELDEAAREDDIGLGSTRVIQKRRRAAIRRAWEAAWADDDQTAV